MASRQVRQFQPSATRPNAYPHDLPFVPQRSCVTSGMPEGGVRTVMWPSDDVQTGFDERGIPTELRSALEARLGGVPTGIEGGRDLLGRMRDQASGIAEAMNAMAVPDAVLHLYELVCESSHRTGWSFPHGKAPSPRASHFERGGDTRLVTVSPVGVLLWQFQGPAAAPPAQAG